MLGKGHARKKDPVTLVERRLAWWSAYFFKVFFRVSTISCARSRSPALGSRSGVIFMCGPMSSSCPKKQSRAGSVFFSPWSCWLEARVRNRIALHTFVSSRSIGPGRGERGLTRIDGSQCPEALSIASAASRHRSSRYIGPMIWTP
jgi:hypothetical protein